MTWNPKYNSETSPQEKEDWGLRGDLEVDSRRQDGES